VEYQNSDKGKNKGQNARINAKFYSQLDFLAFLPFELIFAPKYLIRSR
jgi:hypothetical protein